MKKIRVGIFGYGNLGKALEKELKKDERFRLVAVFSRRIDAGTERAENIVNYKDKIDLLFVCVGSQNDLESVTTTLIQHFNILECYDNHNRFASYLAQMNKLAKRSKKVALCCFGWDPGLFSMMRALFDALGCKQYTFWGKGLSQGHTQAIKNIVGVEDAIQFTIPNTKEMNRIKKGAIVVKDKHLHQRLCYVVAAKDKQQRIKQEIVNMPDYFAGYKTIVRFVSREKLAKLKTFQHQGEVTTRGDVLNFSLRLSSNPEFTAKVAVAYAYSIKNFQKEERYGAFTILDVPLSYITTKNKTEYL